MASNNSYRLPAGLSKIRLTLLAAGLCLPSLFGQAQSSGYLTVGEPQKAAGKRNAALQVKIPMAVKEGYHVNSNKPNEEYLIPLKVTWTSLGALEGGAVTYPKPESVKYEFSEQPLSVYTGAFDLVANFKVASNAAAGPGAATGKLRYQACSNRACYPPKTVEITVSYQVQ
jgi:DsbC/DsbD-like thiol-disulfide interchange protein